MTRQPWGGGYVVDVPYLSSAYPQLTPAWLSAAAVVHGQPPVRPDRRLTWMELGCGHGMTAIMVAAACPDVDVWACDFNPAHVEYAQSLIEAAEIDNCVVEEVSFEELAGDTTLGPSKVDMIAAHGVFSWVSPEVRGDLVRVITQRLRPGGLALVSYNVVNGWLGLRTSQQLVAALAGHDPRPSDVAVLDALQVVLDLDELGAPGLGLAAFERGWLTEQVRPENTPYLAHELINTDWHLLSLDEVAAHLAEAKCAFVGPSSISAASMQMRVQPEVLDWCQQMGDQLLAEAVIDLCRSTGFRSDVFRRGLAQRSVSEIEADVRALTFVGLPHRRQVGDRVQVQAGEVVLSAEYYGVLLERLVDGPLSVGEVEAWPNFAGVPPRDIAATFGVLVEAGVCAPVWPGWDGETPDSTRRLNEVLLHRALSADAGCSLVSPVTTGPVHLAAESIERYQRSGVLEPAYRHLGVVC